MKPPPGRILAFDYGEVRIGLAVSDPDRTIASPLATYQRRDPATDQSYFEKLFNDETPTVLLVGLPVHLSGEEGESAGKARRFGHWLGTFSSIPVRFYDERFSTVQAESALWSAGLTHKKRKERRDRVAAQMLLQAYLDVGCPDDEGGGAIAMK